MHLQLPQQFDSDQTVPDWVFGYASATSQGGLSVFAAEPQHLADSVERFHSTAASLAQGRSVLESWGFIIHAESSLGFALSGPPQAWEALTGGKIVAKERMMHTVQDEKRYVTHLDIVGDGQPDVLGVGAVDTSTTGIEGVVLNRPRFCHAVVPSPIPPTVPKFHLRVPQDVATGLNAQQAQQHGFRGQNVVVAMVDTGHYRHPFFVAQHYHIRPTRAIIPHTSPSKDPVGHGTGESANIFAIAPGATLQAYRTSGDHGEFQPETGFLVAKHDALAGGPNAPRVITNSWGGDSSFPPSLGSDPATLPFVAEVRDAIAHGVVVVFSAGNGHFSYEPQIPGVLSAGGVFMDQGLRLQASTYASGYHSPWFGGTDVPLVCGLVGMLPRAQYLMLPVQIGCELDRSESAPDPPNDPTTDGTTATDGWALFSGTSAAAPQLAGAVAVLLSAKPQLTPAQVIEALTKTATDVTAGRNHPRFNNAAVLGHDLATGFGLANVSAAVDYAQTHF